ncbi:hypothetical protein BLNAU_4952 [Blattamonas nauphoetae]|uniref:Uncharacterized protein n=1 Tax=Blattamonas nauphoetae TaxID=2049346 RepID=A0ABQ9Y8P3_9EUKA|nr:hypothetical protein BLNAU_4952 [Blattamonas nauphoetae]
MNCSSGIISNGGGGGLTFYECEQLRMDSIQFRECRGREGNDIRSSCWTASELTSNVTNCDSTSGSPSWYFNTSKESNDSLIPQTTTTRTLKSIVSSLEADGVSATLLATVSGSVRGTMLVLVDNTDSEDERTANSAPAIQRLLSFAFASPSTTSSLTVRCGDWEILQLGQSTPNPPRLMGVLCRSGTGLNHVWLGLVGRGVVAGMYNCWTILGNWKMPEKRQTKCEPFLQLQIVSCHSTTLPFVAMLGVLWENDRPSAVDPMSENVLDCQTY